MELTFCHFFLQNRPTIAAGLVGTGSSILQFLTGRELYDLFKTCFQRLSVGIGVWSPIILISVQNIKKFKKNGVVFQHTTAPLKFFGRHGIPDGTGSSGQPINRFFLGKVQAR